MIDPTGAGDTFAGGLVGYVAAHPAEPVNHELLTRAIAYGTSLASYNVEEFGTERVARLTADEVSERVNELAQMTSFDAIPLALRDWGTVPQWRVAAQLRERARRAVERDRRLGLAGRRRAEDRERLRVRGVRAVERLEARRELVERARARSTGCGGWRPAACPA